MMIASTQVLALANSEGAGAMGRGGFQIALTEGWMEWLEV